MNRDEKISTIIELCKDIDIDGETMEYILEKVAMTDQMLRQLVMNNPQSNIIDLLNEKIELDNERLGLANN
jgi:3-oxoacyl-[acyl-carrier-protein] synthase III